MTRRGLTCLLAIGAVLLAAVGIASASRMVSTKLSPTLCQTTGGGKFVPIPGYEDEMIDRRLLTDIKWLTKRYKIFITDGYSMDDVHAENGEHPIGLALDIVPNKAAGGTWADITRLARWAEPRQNQPRSPFRWVGYDGDAGHGRGNHLHLSYSHTDTRAGRPATTIESIRCPGATGTGPTVPGQPEPPTGGSPEVEPPAGGRGDRGGREGRGGRGGRSNNGGRNQGTGGNTGGTGGRGDAGSNSGGVSGKVRWAAPVVETGGVGLN